MHGHRQGAAGPAHCDQAFEDTLFFPVKEAVKRQTIFAYVGMDEEGHLGTLWRQRAKGGHADDDGVPDSAGFDNRLLWLFREEAPAQVRNHALILPFELMAIGDLKIIARVGWKEPGHMAQPLRQRWRGQQRILALPQIRVVEVKREREHINGQRIGERGFKEAALRPFVDPALFDTAACEGLIHAGESAFRHACAGAFVAAAVQCPAAALVAILAGFATYVRQCLRPSQVAETLWHPNGFDKMVADIDKELEG